MDDASIFSREPMADYRARRAEFLTSHQLIDYAGCPLRYRRRMDGLISERSSEAYLIGSATHCLTLEGREAFEREYIVGGPENPKTQRPYGSETKAFREWAQASGKTALSDDQYMLVAQLASAVRSHELAAELLRDGIAEGVLRAEYDDVPCQIRVDWFSPEWGIVDLKTCEDLDNFEADARRFNYIPQMAFYRGVYSTAVGVVPFVYLIAVEKRDPQRCGVWLLDSDALGCAERRNVLTMRDLIVSRRENVWPTRYEELRTLAA